MVASIGCKQMKNIPVDLHCIIYIKFEKKFKVTQILSVLKLRCKCKQQGKSTINTAPIFELI